MCHGLYRSAGGDSDGVVKDLYDVLIGGLFLWAGPTICTMIIGFVSFECLVCFFTHLCSERKFHQNLYTPKVLKEE